MESCKEEKNDSGKSVVDLGASSNSESTARSAGSKDEESSNSLECPICLQNCIHPVELPCSHIFCFLCIKGVAAQGPHSRCAICRQDIPHNVLTNPRLKDISQLYKDPTLSSGFQWFYESRSDGWWLYDERTMQELEKAFESKQSTFQIMIAGYMYEIDFDQMIQYRVNNPTMSRRIKRDLPTTEKRGIAGIRLNTKKGDGTNNHSNGAAAIRRGGSSASTARNRSSPSNNLSESQRTLSMPHLTNQVDGPPVFEVDTDSDEEDEQEADDDDCPDSLDDEEDDDDDMELGEEEEDDDDDDNADEADAESELREGARAPTSRSDRSNSSNNQTTPPSTPSQFNGQSGGRGSHTRAGHSRNISTNTSSSASSGNSRNNSAEPIIINIENNSSETSVQRLEEHNRTSPPASFEIDSNVSNCNVLNTSPALSDNNQYIIIGPSLQIRLQYNNDVPMPVDEIL